MVKEQKLKSIEETITELDNEAFFVGLKLQQACSTLLFTDFSPEYGLDIQDHMVL